MFKIIIVIINWRALKKMYITINNPLIN